MGRAAGRAGGLVIVPAAESVPGKDAWDRRIRVCGVFAGHRLARLREGIVQPVGQRIPSLQRGSGRTRRRIVQRRSGRRTRCKCGERCGEVRTQLWVKARCDEKWDEVE